MNKPMILIVEDTKPISLLITTTIEAAGYKCRAVQAGQDAIMEAASGQIDIMLLDLGLPDMSGVNVIEKVREWSNMPIIVISAHSDDKDKVEALDAGADDYLTKPFSVEELMARLRVSLRRVRYDATKAGAEVSVFENGGLKIDYAAGCAWVDGKEIRLTPNEYKLLSYLAKNAGKVLTYNAIVKEIWGDYYPSEVSALRVFVATLRKKIEKTPSSPKYIQTHVRIGYRMLQVSEK